MRRYLICLLLIAAAQASAGPRLYVMNCGELALDSMGIFGLSDTDTPVRTLFVPCYLVRHEQGLLFWDGGLPYSVAQSKDVVTIEGGSMVYERWVMDQLADMGVAPEDITYAAFSHLHFDHAGAANALVKSEIIMQRKEWDAAFGEAAQYVDTSLFDGLKDASLTFIDGDHDVFGDGSVRLIFTPGHTPGHQVLLLDLENTGEILLSGDLYHTRANRLLRRVPTFNINAAQTLDSMEKVEKLLEERGATLWIEHDKALADSLRLAPHYYD